MKRTSKWKVVEQWMAICMLVGISSLVFVLFQRRCNESLAWIGTTVSVPKYRGAHGADRPPVYSEKQLSALGGLLRKSVSRAYDQIKPHGFRLTFQSLAEYQMQASLRELFDGGIAIEVNARHAEDRWPVQTWVREFESEQAFRAGYAGFGEEVARALAAH